VATSSESSEIRPAPSNIIRRYASPFRPETDCKMNDLEWLFDVKIRFQPALCCGIDASFGAHCTNLMKIDPYYLVSGNIRFMQIFTGVPLGRDIKRHCMGVVDDGNFWRFRWLRLRKLQRYGKQYYGDMLQPAPCRLVTDCKMNNLEWLFHVKIRFRPARLESERLNVKK